MNLLGHVFSACLVADHGPLGSTITRLFRTFPTYDWIAPITKLEAVNAIRESVGRPYSRAEWSIRLRRTVENPGSWNDRRSQKSQYARNARCVESTHRCSLINARIETAARKPPFARVVTRIEGDEVLNRIPDAAGLNSLFARFASAPLVGQDLRSARCHFARRTAVDHHSTAPDRDGDSHACRSNGRKVVKNESARGRARGARTAPEEELRRKPIAPITQQDRLRA